MFISHQIICSIFTIFKYSSHFHVITPLQQHGSTWPKHIKPSTFNNCTLFHLSTSKYLINNHWDLVLIFQKLIDMIQIFSNIGILKSFELQKWLLKHKFTSKFLVVLKYLIAIVVNFIIFWEDCGHTRWPSSLNPSHQSYEASPVTLNRSLNNIFIQNKYFYSAKPSRFVSWN